MAGGASSRMKRSIDAKVLDARVREIAMTHHKSLIPLGQEGKPMLHYLIKNAHQAGYTDCYIITSSENQGFKNLVGDENTDNFYEGLKVHFAIQHLPEGGEKALGTADALLQCLQQHEHLKNERFTVCNGDNLYTIGALTDLQKNQSTAHSTIGYSGAGLGFSKERLTNFAVMDVTDHGFLRGIIEKPTLEKMESYRGADGLLLISMNIFNFSGFLIFPYLENCPVHPQRGEKELPEAVRLMVVDHPKSVLCIRRSETMPDLTRAGDIKNFNSYL